MLLLVYMVMREVVIVVFVGGICMYMYFIYICILIFIEYCLYMYFYILDNNELLGGECI